LCFRVFFVKLLVVFTLKCIQFWQCSANAMLASCLRPARLHSMFTCSPRPRAIRARVTHCMRAVQERHANSQLRHRVCPYLAPTSYLGAARERSCAASASSASYPSYASGALVALASGTISARNLVRADHASRACL
jgi:hypothetical protein